MKSWIWWNRFHFVIWIAAFLCFCVLTYLFSFYFDRSFDVTRAKRFTLSEETKQVLNRLNSPVDIYVFYHNDQKQALGFLRDLLDAYRAHQNLIHLELIELDREPLKAQHFGIERYGEMILVSGDRRERIVQWEEEAITNAMLRLQSDQRAPVYFTEGHGEAPLHSAERIGLGQFRDYLVEKNYQPSSLVLSGDSEIPENADVIVSASPKTDFFEDEIEKLDAFLAHGGSIIVLSDPGLSAQPIKLESFLLKYGIQLGDDVIVDGKSYQHGTDAVIPIVNRFTDHPISRGLGGDVTLAMARSVKPAPTTEKLSELMVLASTSEDSWAETDLATLESGHASFDEKDGVPGLVPVAVLAEGFSSAPRSESHRRYRIVAVGDSDFLTNSLIRVGANREFGLGMIRWLAGHERFITLKTRSSVSTPLYLTTSDRVRLFLSIVIAVPLIVLLTGFWISFRRKHIPAPAHV